MANNNALAELCAFRVPSSFDDKREVLVSESLEKRLRLCKEWNTKVEKCQRQKKQMADKNSRCCVNSVMSSG